jgi:hypothetical protein
MILNLKTSKEFQTEFRQGKTKNKGKDIDYDNLSEKETELLYQLVETVFTIGRNNEALRRVIGFPTSGRRRWILLLLREEEISTAGKWNMIENYHFHPVDTSLVVPLWHRLNRTVADPSGAVLQISGDESSRRNLEFCRVSSQLLSNQMVTS